MLTAYTQVHVYKALCLMSNHVDYYTEFVKDVVFWSSHDPTMVTLPVLVMAMNYTLIQRSRHPFLVNVRQRWTPMSKALFVLYGSGIAMVLPQTYLISYLAFGTTHLLINSLTARLLNPPTKESKFESYLREKGLKSDRNLN